MWVSCETAILVLPTTAREDWPSAWSAYCVVFIIHLMRYGSVDGVGCRTGIYQDFNGIGAIESMQKSFHFLPCQIQMIMHLMSMKKMLVTFIIELH